MISRLSIDSTSLRVPSLLPIVAISFVEVCIPRVDKQCIDVPEIQSVASHAVMPRLAACVSIPMPNPLPNTVKEMDPVLTSLAWVITWL